MSDDKKTDPGAVDDDAIGRAKRAREAQKKAIKEAMDTDSSAAWNRGRNAAEPGRKRSSKIRST
jgi:hypothetical protein